MIDVIKACPICGMVVLHTCYHDGDDVSSVLMSIGAAEILRSDWQEDCRHGCSRAESFRQEARTKVLVALRGKLACMSVGSLGNNDYRSGFSNGYQDAKDDLINWLKEYEGGETR